MNTFKIVLDTDPEYSLTIEFPETKNCTYEYSSHSLRIYDCFYDYSFPKGIPTFEYRLCSEMLKSVIGGVSHIPMMNVELENADVLKLSWEGDRVKDPVIENIYNASSDYSMRIIPPDNYNSIIINGKCSISDASGYYNSWLFNKHKVRSIQMLRTSRPDDSTLERRLDSDL